ncbi:MAG: HAMP domain-containing protein [Armatimonadetes bacterium]|nr:HAMP domain-containing protein [Armatimonadota bacterium]
MKHASIQRFLLFSLGAIILAFVTLGVGWLLSVARLQDMKTGLFADAQSLENSYRLELAVRSARNGAGERAQAATQADRFAARLRDSVTSPEETALVRNVEAHYRTWRQGGGAEPLLNSIAAHRALNERRMSQTMRRGERLERAVRVWPPLLIALSGLALGLGGWKLWSRVFGPMLRLSHAAEEFGKGAMTARVPVVRDDEMGALCRSFNTMADAIRDREGERLRFVATVAHDLKSPLMVVGMAASLMRKKELPPDQNEAWLECIGRNTRQMECIVADLTDGVQAQTGQLELNREALDLAELAADVVRDQREALRCQARHAGHDPDAPTHTLRFEGDESCPILGDRQRLERVLVNLISNAVKYSPPEREVRVAVWRRGTGVRLTVEDEGQGIAPEDLGRLFQPFARLEGTRHMASGTGLGLVSVQKIIHAHGGEIRVSSQSGRGTTVEICLHLRPQNNTKEPL